MKECAEAKQIRYYGLNKVDPKLVKVAKGKSLKSNRMKLVTESIKLKEKIKKLKESIKGCET